VPTWQPFDGNLDSDHPPGSCTVGGDYAGEFRRLQHLQGFVTQDGTHTRRAAPLVPCDTSWTSSDEDP